MLPTYHLQYHVLSAHPKVHNLGLKTIVSVSQNHEMEVRELQFQFVKSVT